MDTEEPTHDSPDDDLPESPSESPAEDLAAVENPLNTLLMALSSEVVTTRLEAVQKLGQLAGEEGEEPGKAGEAGEVGNEEALRALEQTAAQDDDQEVREAALQTLHLPLYRLAQRQRNRLSSSLRQTILKEIARWETDGLITAQLAGVLKQRYYLALPQSAATGPTEATVKDEPRSLSETLLSETTIKIALYLGAFFVISAACILALAVEGARLPTLIVGTVGFLSAAFLIRKRLPQASFIFFIIFTFMIPLDAGVLQTTLEVSQTAEIPYWLVVTLCLALLWAVGTFFYRSRFFSLLVLAASSGAMGLLGRWLDQTPHLDLFLIAIPTLGALGGVFILRWWQDEPFARPLFWLAQLQHLSLLGVSTFLVIFTITAQDWPFSGWWALIAITWLIGAVFYFISHRLWPFLLFPGLTAVTLIIAPLLFSGVFSPTERAMIAITWAWGAILVLGGDALNKVDRFELRIHSPYLIGASAILFSAVAAGSLADEVAIGLGYLVGTLIIYGGLAIYRSSWVYWTGALVAATLAYFTLFALPALKAWDVYLGFMILWPALALLTIYLLARRRFKAQNIWYLPPLFLGSFLGIIALSYTLGNGYEAPLRAAIVFAITAVFITLFGLVENKPKLGYGATTTLALALGFILLHFDLDTSALPLIILASLYFLAGLVAIRLESVIGEMGGLNGFRLKDWAGVLRISGLVLGSLVALLLPVQGGPISIIGPALVATYFTFEAFRLRNVWLGLPANLLYLLAYLMILTELDVSEPQFYSIGAALLGFIMHYFLVKSGSRLGAFIIGLISQLILLGTTYIQMLSNEAFLFFAVLFLQALVVLVYGVVVRAKSLVIAPIAFVVLGVITATFSALAGIPTIILIGCTGLLLLALGVLALLMRERLLMITDQLKDRFEGWRS